jgi:hypothetical protein
VRGRQDSAPAEKNRPRIEQNTRFSAGLPFFAGLAPILRCPLRLKLRRRHRHAKVSGVFTAGGRPDSAPHKKTGENRVFCPILALPGAFRRFSACYRLPCRALPPASASLGFSRFRRGRQAGFRRAKKQARIECFARFSPCPAFSAGLVPVSRSRVGLKLRHLHRLGLVFC